MTVKKLIRTSDLDLENYVDTSTGEYLLDQLSTGDSLKYSKVDPDMVIMTSDSFITVEVEALEILLRSKIITTADMGKILLMSKTLRTPLNAMYRSTTIPHTLETISELIDNTYDYTTKFVKKLCKKNIMHRYITADKTLYCINPYLTRRRKSIDKELIVIFSKFKK